MGEALHSSDGAQQKSGTLAYVSRRFVRQTAEVENCMTAMERLLEYTRLPQVWASWQGGKGKWKDIIIVSSTHSFCRYHGRGG